jgi:hypothetical protein
VNNDDGERPVPKQYDWATELYKKMLEEATPVEQVAQPGDPVTPVMVYEGHLTRLFSELNIPNPYYTSLMKALKTMGCVEQLRRGGGAAMSQWVLHRAPTEDDFREFRERNAPNTSKFGQLEQQVRDLRRLASAQAEDMEKMQTVIDVLSERITKVEDRVTA